MIYVLIAVGLLLALLLVAGEIGFRIAIVRPKKKKEPKTEAHKERLLIRQRNNENFYALKPEDLSIKSADGLELRAWYLPAEEETKHFALLAHGHKCNGPDEFSHMIPFYHNELKYNVLLPDHRAHGRSEGKYMGFGALDHKDILLWVRYLIDRFGEDIEIILHGISMGAATVMLANSANPPEQVKLIVEDCGFTDCHEETAYVLKGMIGFNFPLIVNLSSAICKIRAGYHFKDADCLGQMKNAARPVLFIHGDADTYVPTEMVYRLHEACPTPKDLLIVKGAIHAYSYYDAPELYQKKVKDFFAKYM